MKEDELIRRFGVIFTFVNVALLCYIFAFPVQDLLYGSTYSFAWWAILLFAIFNFLQPIMLMGTIAAYKSPARTDIHSMFTIFAIVINGLVAIFFTFAYFAWINTSYSGNWPFNDHRWCCVYYIANPELCSNTGPCVPAVTDAMLSANSTFTMLWIFSLVFFFVSLLHLGVNKLLRDAGAVAKANGKVDDGKMMGILIAFIYLGVFCYWCAWPLFDTLYIHGYPVFAIPPSPGPYASRLYAWQWSFVYLNVLNIIPPFVFMVAAVMRKSIFLTSAHFWLTILTHVASVISFIVLLGILIFDCNNSWSGGSICNSDLWCCSYFASAPTLCPNVTPCTATLRPNSQFLQHLVFSLIFWLLSLVQIWVNYRMKKYGVFAN